MSTPLLANPFGNFHYLVEIDGVMRGAFGYCAGLGRPHRHVDFYISDDEIDLVDMANEAAEETIVLAQGFAFDDTLPRWKQALAEGHAERHDGAIIVVDDFGRQRARWRFRGAWPSTIECNKAQGESRTHIETLELMFEELREN